MDFVDTLTPAVLERVKTTLLDLLEEGIVVAVREEGEGYVSTAKAVIPAAAPPKCIVDLLRVFSGRDQSGTIRSRHQSISEK